MWFIRNQSTSIWIYLLNVSNFYPTWKHILHYTETQVLYGNTIMVRVKETSFPYEAGLHHTKTWLHRKQICITLETGCILKGSRLNNVETHF
jgi:hypothetical protein